MMETTCLTITPLAPFNFRHTAYSHGWIALAPNSWNKERESVQRVQRLSTARVVLLSIAGSGSMNRPRIEIEALHRGALSSQEQVEITRMVGHMFRAEEDLSDFYALCKRRGGPWSRVRAGLGRLMRSPTVFEDVVKTICTTNIQWGGTKRMVAELVSVYGQPYPDDTSLRAFPAAEAIASVPLETFSSSVNLGYRRPYVHALAVRVVSGELHLESLLDPSLPTSDVKKKLLTIKGVGNYAATNLLMLLGRYDELAVDTVFRQFVNKKYFPEKRPSDRETLAIYDDWGSWKYLAYWFDIWSSFQGEF